MTTDQTIEAILFWKGEPVSRKKLMAILGCTITDLENGLKNLEERLKNTGLTLVYKEDEVMLGTKPEASALIQALTKEELSRDLGKAGLETLSIILYKGPIARRGIDYIRGVNSNFILRNLMIRGLVEKIQSPDDQRSFLYKPTFDLLTHLGVSRIEDLPEYGSIVPEIEQALIAEDPASQPTPTE
ncbi:MAG: SMC-Scp complex subunit ScpB [Candidatus Pacebacteria bacterium]|nr:SMC-Scp complex subunit ScpB [Candidatus Paceibacterota bacterium]